MTYGRSVPSQLLASMPHVTLAYTCDESILRGRDARWFAEDFTIVAREGLRGTRWHDQMLHELGHVVLGHPSTCDNAFYDQRNELEADAFAAVHVLPNLEAMAVELATASTYSHAARNMGTCLDLLEVRLANLTSQERELVDGIVWSVHEGRGA